MNENAVRIQEIMKRTDLTEDEKEALHWMLVMCLAGATPGGALMTWRRKKEEPDEQ